MREAWEDGPDAARCGPDEGWADDEHWVDGAPLDVSSWRQVGYTVDTSAPFAQRAGLRPPMPPLRLTPPPMRVRIDPDALARIHADLRRAVRDMDEAMRPAVRALRRAHADLARAGIVEDPAPRDARERALRARQRRNTGPGGWTYRSDGKRLR